MNTTHAQHKPPSRYRWITVCLAGLLYAYCVGVCVWIVLYLVYGDRWWWLFLLNSFSLYLFLPIPVCVGLAFVVRQRGVWGSIGLVTLIWLGLYGGYWMPKRPSHSSSSPTVLLMTYNTMAFGSQGQAERIVDEILDSQADVVAVQELTPSVAKAIQRRLSEVYPHQILRPRGWIEGMGVMSRYPLREINVTIPKQFGLVTQVVEVTVAETAVTLINFHGRSSQVTTLTQSGVWELVERLRHQPLREREQQIQAIVSFARQRAGPVLLTGDLNATDRSVAYAIATDTFHDAWRTAGMGFGHTFPGARWAETPWEWKRIAGIPVPVWLMRWVVRLDFILYSDEWRALDAWIGPWKRGSDHRPVVAKLALVR